MRKKVLTGLAFLLIGLLWANVDRQFLPKPVFAQDLIPIGRIQGETSESDYKNLQVRIRAIVTGILEDENAGGTRFYTVFVQDLPGSEDGNPRTSDGLAIFAGARRPALAVGDIVTIGGVVTEFYGLTELDNNNLFYSVESRNNPLPEPAAIDPPTGNQDAAVYLERFEGMRVAIPEAIVVGPSHIGCGFSVVSADGFDMRIVVNSERDPAGQIVGALHPSDVNCDEMPAVGFGDRIDGLAGPLTFHFDRFKIVYQDHSELTIDPAERPAPLGPTPTSDDQFVVATFNVNDYFDINDDTGGAAEPKFSVTELALKKEKTVATIAEGLNCPHILGLQEVENNTLLVDLTARLAERCGFVYQVNHLDGPDLRGADVALLSKPGLVQVASVAARQSCTDVETDVVDLSADCPPGQKPLFSRPPLQVGVVVDGRPIAILVNHFKSKRGGAAETAAWRLAQAEYVSDLSKEIQRSFPGIYIIVMGDFNDYGGSVVMQQLEGEGELVDALRTIPPQERYSYIFDGASQLIDWILVSPALSHKVVDFGIIHRNADFPFQLGRSAAREHLALRSSDHDIPYVIIDLSHNPTPSHTPIESSTTAIEATARPDKLASSTETSSQRTTPTVTEPTTQARIDVSPQPSETAIPVIPEKPGTPSISTSPSEGMDRESAAVLAVAGAFFLASSILLAAVIVRNRRKMS